MNFKLTSGGTETGAPPIRDRAAGVVEKHRALDGWERAGTRNVGTDFERIGWRKSCTRQRCEAAQDMVAGVVNVVGEVVDLRKSSKFFGFPETGSRDLLCCKQL
jgi:hypothetical protein